MYTVFAPNWKEKIASQFNFSYRYIDDVLSINNPDFVNYLGQMYSPELEIKDTTESNTSASYLDLLLSIESDGQLRTSLYDKRDDFNFHITNFPFLSSNIPSSHAYGVFISQLIRYARACSSYECFILRASRLSPKLLGQGYVIERLRWSLRKFNGRYGDLIKHYGVSLSQVLHAILAHDHIQWHTQLIRHYTILRACCRAGHCCRFWLCCRILGVSVGHCGGCSWPTGGACSSGHLVLSHLGLAFVLMLRPFFPELVMSTYTDLLILELPSVLLFCLKSFLVVYLSVPFYRRVPIPFYIC